MSETLHYLFPKYFKSLFSGSGADKIPRGIPRALLRLEYMPCSKRLAAVGETDIDRSNGND